MTARRGPGPRRSERGQATLELLGAIPVLLALGLVILQLLAVGYTAVLAGAAAEAGALALAGGRDPAAGVRASLPGWSKDRVRVSTSGGAVKVELRPPALLSILERELAVNATASVRS